MWVEVKRMDRLVREGYKEWAREKFGEYEQVKPGQEEESWEEPQERPVRLAGGGRRAGSVWRLRNGKCSRCLGLQRAQASCSGGLTGVRAGGTSNTEERRLHVSCAVAAEAESRPGPRSNILCSHGKNCPACSQYSFCHLFTLSPCAESLQSAQVMQSPLNAKHRAGVSCCYLEPGVHNRVWEVLLLLPIVGTFGVKVGPWFSPFL